MGTGENSPGLDPVFATYTESAGRPGTVAASTDEFSSAAPWATHLGDIDGDGRGDIARLGETVLEYTCGQNDGFTGTIYQQTTTTRPKVSTLADVNGDGKADLIGMSPAAGGVLITWIALGGVDCSLSEWIELDRTNIGYGELPVDIDQWRLASGDFNGDGLSDVVLFGSASDQLLNARILLQRLGSRTARLSPAQWFASSSWTRCPNVAQQAPGVSPQIGIADINGDSRSDVVIQTKNASTTNQGVMTTALGASGGLLQPFDRCSLYWSGVLGDVDGDGRHDLTGADNSAGFPAGTGTIHYQTTTGAYVLRDGWVDPCAHDTCQSVSRLRDISGDGIQDLFTRDQYEWVHEQFQYTLGGIDGFENRALGFTSDLDQHERRKSNLVELGDFNGDGLADVWSIFVESPDWIYRWQYWSGGPAGLPSYPQRHPGKWRRRNSHFTGKQRAYTRKSHRA